VSVSEDSRVAHLLAFTLDGRPLALFASAVTEVARAVSVSLLPKAPPIVEGVINYRGSVVPVLDIRRRFGQPPKPVELEQHLIVARAGGRLVAIRVDRATDVIAVEAAAIESAAASAPGAEYLAGIARLPDGLLVIHDLDTFLALDEGAQLDAALADAHR